VTTTTTLSPGLRRLEKMVLAGEAHPAIVTRRHTYDVNSPGELVRDIASLANLRVRGQRFVVFGVTQEDGSAVQIASLSEADHALGLKFERLVAKCIEPPLRVRYVRWRAQSVSLGVLIVDDCKDAPYLIRKDLLPVTQVGDAWTRRRNQCVRMRRDDLDKFYTEKFSGPLCDGHVRVQFAGDPPSEYIRLTAAHSAQLPSSVASNQIEALVASRRLAMNAASSQLTYIGRLSQARIMGCDTPYADKGLATLKLELAKVADSFRAADEHYRFEQHAHSINLQLVIEGDCDIDSASLVLLVPANIGIAISSSAPAANDTHPNNRGPQVELSREVIRISEHYERLQASKVNIAFRQPLRVVMDVSAAGHKIPIHYRLQGRNLRHAVSGKLYIVCSALADG
jgi:hypothetical protein